MAQPSFDSILNAVMLAESGGRRYDSKGNLLTSDKGARGEMQVLDTTKFQPGFGVEPARADTPDERARVGRDYLRAMLDRYGDIDKALAAYNWGPGNTDKWIARGADPAKLPAETQGYISKIKSSLAGAPRTTAQAAASVKPEAAALPEPAAGAPRAAPVKVSEARPADLGASYQAALALSFLSDEDEKEGGRREYDERQPSVSSQWLARQTARVSPEMLAMPYRSPFREPEPVKAAGGGLIAVGYEDGGEVGAVASKSTEQPSRPEPFRIPPGQTEARLREFNRLDPATRSLITRDDPRVEFALTPAPTSVSTPYTLSTMPGARALYDQTLAGTTTGGYVHPALKMQSRAGKEVAPQDVVFLRPGRDQAQELQSRAHEAEHLLAKRGLGDATAINDKFDELMKDSRARRAFVEGAVSVQPYLEKTYGTKSSYFMPEMLAFQDKRGRGANLLYEQFAELAAIEQATGKDLTKDPELRKTIFKDKKVREVYNAMTGLRQTRLDARDLSPYTPIPEKPEGVMGFIRSKLGFAEGGEAKSEEPTAEELERASKPAFGIVPSSGKGRKQGRVSQALQSGEAQKELAKGLTMLPQNVVGAPVDIATLVARPFGYNVEKPVMGSEWLKEKSRAAGLAFQEPEDPTLRAFFTAGDISSNLINPAGATRTAVRGVEKTGQAAKELAEFATRPVERDPFFSGSLGSQRGAVRLPGGHFPLVRAYNPKTGQYEQVDQVAYEVKSSLANTGDKVLDNWLMNKVGAYLRRDLGTERDPFFRAAEEGRKTHIFPGGEKELLRDPDFKPAQVPNLLRGIRSIEGFPELGFAKTEMGRRVETASDYGVFPEEIQNYNAMSSIPPGLRQFVETNPTMRLNELQSGVFSGGLKLKELRNSMLAMRKSPDYERYGQFIEVPERYRLSDKMLEGMSPIQASERVAQFENWKTDANGILAGRAIREDASLSKRELPDKSLWLNAPDLKQNPRIRELVQDLGCDGGWCTDKELIAEDYGSGENRLAILMDPKNRPVAQLTVSQPAPLVKDFLQDQPEMADLFNVRAEDLWSRQIVQAIERSPQFRDWASRQPANMRIIEIKGRNNETELRPTTYVKNIQDYVKDLDRSHDLLSVDNLAGIGLTNIIPQVQQMVAGTSLTSAQLQALQKEAIRLNGGSKYVNTISKDSPGTPDYSELNSLLNQAYKNAITP